MEIDDPKIVALREKVTAAQQKFDVAVTFHEVWKPAAYDIRTTGSARQDDPAPVVFQYWPRGSRPSANWPYIVPTTSQFMLM
jgi:hypothetical protein